MATLNKIQLIGRVGGVPTYAEPKTDFSVTRFSLATTDKYKDKEETQWHNITAFNKIAQFVHNHIHKGDCVYVEGKVKYQTYKTKEGEEKQMTVIEATNIQILSNPKAKEDYNDLP